MKETQRRIKAYKEALPGLKERIAAVAVLLAMSVAMMTSATFAWLTISRAPEVTGVNTTVAANGNLEIALVSKDGSQPAESAVGDSSAAQGQSVTGANLTWGNLINLSDPSYGLDNLTLRPAQLNLSALLTSPLYGAVYTQDGRIEKLNSSFAYASWSLVEGSTEYRFVVPETGFDYGVRAISSTKIEAVGFPAQVVAARAKAEEANTAAGSIYIGITQKSEWMDTLAYLMGTYMTANLNSGQGDESLTNPTIEKEHILNLTEIFRAFIATYEQQFVAEAEMLNYQLFLINAPTNTPYTPYTAAMLQESTVNEASLKILGLQLTGFNTMKSDYSKLVENFAKVEALCELGTVKWVDSGLDDIVDSLMNVGTCTLDGTKIGSIGASNATGYLDGNTHNAVITNGVLYNFEKLNGTSRCEVKNLQVSAKVKRMGITIPASISANITTNAPAVSQFSVDLTAADKLNQGGTGTQVAQDTYGLAIDLWVRTNAPNSYLTLEGNVLTDVQRDVPVLGKDSSGNEVNIYELTRSQEVTDAEGNSTTESFTIDLYKLESEDADGNTVTSWYNATTHSLVTLEDGETPVLKLEDIVTVIGYEGENRVWVDNSMLSTDSTTQGSGSCYVYYADTPEDQARSLKLLGSMNVAFVDDKGTLLATAVMDTENYYAENGRVTVPLVLSSDSISLGEDSSGVETLAITALEQNVAKRITAIVYLDGRSLSNADVLAASDIQGKLNIQFGSSQTLVHAEDETLENATRSVSATLEGTEFSYDTAIETGTAMTTTVTIRVDGDAPKNVSAFFLRAISATQGSREPVITDFTDNGDGTWTGTYTFTAPGNYVLRSVDLDGTTYDLTSPQTVVVHGFTVESLSCEQADGKHISIMTAASSSTVDLKLKFAASDQAAMPSTVQGRFLRSDGTAVNINFTYNSTTGFWTGKANFVTSGEYTLQYLVLDGEYTELDSGLWQTATVYLGMKVAVYTDSPTSFKYLPSEMTDDQKNLYMKVRIMDNTGNPMEGLSGVHLYYNAQGSSIPERGMSAALTWNAAAGYYTGTFSSTDKIGVFSFSTVTVGSNTISTATVSPTFRIMSPNPPEYESYAANSWLFVPDNNGVFTVYMSNSSAATVLAQLRRTDKAATYEVQGTYAGTNDSGYDVWTFKIPVDSASGQDGYWQLDWLKVWNYYDASGVFVSAEIDEDTGLLVEDGQRDEPLYFDLSDQNIVTKAVSTHKVSFYTPENFDNDLGKEADTVTGAFLDSYSINGLYLTIVDFEGVPLPKSYVTKLNLAYNYDGDSANYGGYTSDAITKTDGIFTLDLLGSVTEEDDAVLYTQTTAQTVQYAGVYSPQKLTYTINGREYTLNAYTATGSGKLMTEAETNALTVRVWSKAPTVTISSVSTNPTTARYYLTSTPSSLNVITGSFNTKIDNYNAVVYMYVAAQSGTLDQEQVAIKYPTVTLGLSGVPTTHSGVTMAFPSGNNTTSTFSFAAGKTTATASIGAGTDGVFNEGFLGVGAGVDTWPVFYPAGKQTVQTITVTYGGATYTVNLSDAVTINNPLYPPYATFGSTASGQTLPTTPSTIYATPKADGTFTITLPGTQTWTEAKSSTTNGDFVVQSGYPSTRNVYTERSETIGCSTTTYYTPYIETTTVSKATSSTTTWTRTWKITGWKVGNTTYAVGETITIEGHQTFTPVLSYTDGTKTTNSSTTTRTVIAYTANGSESTTKPSGSKVDSVTGSTTDVVS